MNLTDLKDYYSLETIATLQKEFDNLSPEFWHKVYNPFCPVCLEARGRDFIAQLKENQ